MNQKVETTNGQPPYFPDLASCDCFLLSKLKIPYRGQYFKLIKDMKQNKETEYFVFINGVPRTQGNNYHIVEWAVTNELKQCRENDNERGEWDSLNYKYL